MREGPHRAAPHSRFRRAGSGRVHSDGCWSATATLARLPLATAKQRGSMVYLPSCALLMKTTAVVLVIGAIRDLLTPRPPVTAVALPHAQRDHPENRSIGVRQDHQRAASRSYLVGVLWSRTARSPRVPAILRRGHVHDQAPVEGLERQKRSEKGQSRLLTSWTWLERTVPQRADTPRETTSWTRQSAPEYRRSARTRQPWASTIGHAP